MRESVPTQSLRHGETCCGRDAMVSIWMGEVVSANVMMCASCDVQSCILDQHPRFG